MVRGAVPGAKGGWVMIRDAVKHARPKDAPMPASVKKSEKNGKRPHPRKPRPKRRRRRETMKAKVVTLDAKAAGEIDLKDEIYGLEPARGSDSARCRPGNWQSAAPARTRRSPAAK